MAWIDDAARQAFATFSEQVVVSEDVPIADRNPDKAFVKELRALEKARGKKRAAAEAGVSISNWNRWLAGTRKPKAASRANIRGRYEDLRRPPLVKRRRTIEVKRKLKSVRIQISGTARISESESFRRNFAEDDLRTVDLTDLAEVVKSKRPGIAGDYMTGVIQAETGLDVTWPKDDVTIVLV